MRRRFRIFGDATHTHTPAKNELRKRIETKGKHVQRRKKNKRNYFFFSPEKT